MLSSYELSLHLFHCSNHEYLLDLMAVTVKRLQHFIIKVLDSVDISSPQTPEPVPKLYSFNMLAFFLFRMLVPQRKNDQF